MKKLIAAKYKRFENIKQIVRMAQNFGVWENLRLF